jgi:hypothetical protein
LFEKERVGSLGVLAVTGAVRLRLAIAHISYSVKTDKTNPHGLINHLVKMIR